MTDEQPQMDPSSGDKQAAVAEPDKLLRIATMVREMLAEARRAPVDEEGRRMLRDIYDHSVRELREVLNDPLTEELDSMTIDLGTDVPTESELRIAQAQLTGWLEGLFHGIQAAFVAQQMQAQSQLGELRRRAIAPPPGQQEPEGRRGYL